MGSERAQRPRGRIELEWNVVGFQAAGARRHQRAERMLADDAVKDLGLVNGEMGRDVHRGWSGQASLGMPAAFRW
jgi:hypothetical protein